MTTTAEPKVRYVTSIDRAFEVFQQTVNTNPDELAEARRRRDLIDKAFCDLRDVESVFCSGSLARKTHKDPIHDVDSVVIFDRVAHLDWGIDGNGGAQRALDYVAGQVTALLGCQTGTVAKAVVLAEPRNHSVRCDFGDLRGHGFTVDVMPALGFTEQEEDERILVPVAREDRWEVVDPRFFIRKTAERQKAWDMYVPTVRQLKWWKDERKKTNPGLDAKSLLIEMLAYEHMTPALDQPAALQQFFTIAAQKVIRGLLPSDPAGLCGHIQSDVNRDALLRELEQARDLAVRANAQEARGDVDDAIATWGILFGDAFPRPKPAASLNKFAVAPGPVTLPQQTPSRQLRDEPQG